MKESPLGRGFASAAAAAGSSTGTADAMARKDTLDAWRLHPSPENWDTAGDGFLMRARTEQSIDGACWGSLLAVRDGRPAELNRVGKKQVRRRFGHVRRQAARNGTPCLRFEIRAGAGETGVAPRSARTVYV
jgi:hypothetical protein